MDFTETFAQKKISAKTGKFTGEKIALNFYETDIKNVFRILMDVSGKNFAIDKDVSGQVTLSFDKPVPWDQVLDLVLKMNRLGMVFEGDIVRIATLKSLKAEEEERQEALAARQKLEEQKKTLEPMATEYISVNYANAKDDVLPHIVVTEGRGNVTVDARNNQIIITDINEKVKKAKEIVRKIDKVTPQVMIEARIVEATDTFSREIGTSWSITGTRTDGSLGGTLDWDMSATNPPTTSLGAIGLSFSRIAGNVFDIVDARLAASESEGTVKIISAPKILTLDNKPAKIKQGLAYPYNKLDADGNTTTEFKDIALELEVTPHITPDDRVTMKIVIKNNEIGAVINNQISFTTKEAYTELLVDDGDTIVIGGIRKTRKDISEEGLPVLRKIPVIGWLFKTKSNQDSAEELLIFITPRVVQLQQAGLNGG
jgi:type IV pilus assembly protein PilQ